MTKAALIKFALFQIVWLCCAVGAAHGRPAVGLITAAALVLLHLATSPKWGREVLVVGLSGAAGLLFESLLAAFELVQYAAAWPSQSVAPAWMIALWLAFGTTIETTRSVLGSRAIPLATLLGAVFGPMAYLAGERLGALSFATPQWHGWVATSLVWAIAYPGLIALDEFLKSPPVTRPPAG